MIIKIARIVQTRQPAEFTADGLQNPCEPARHEIIAGPGNETDDTRHARGELQCNSLAQRELGLDELDVVSTLHQAGHFRGRCDCVVERAKAAGVTVTFNTNGMLLAPDLGRRFVALGVDAIAFSIDGASRGLFEEIRAGANFRTVVDNIEFLCSERDRRGPGSPQVIVSFVPMKDNVRELPELISLCSRVGVHDLCFESLLAPAPDWNPGYRDYHRDHTLAHVSPDELHDLAERSQELAHEVGVALHPPGFLEGWKREPESPPSEGGPPPALEPISSSGSNDPPPKNHGVECTMPWTTVYVSISGVVQTCCMSARVLGNLGEQTFAEIWNGEAFRSYRREMAERRFPAECATCLSNGRNRLDLPDLLKPRYAWGTSRAGRWRPLVARFVPAPVRRKIGDWLLTRS